MGKWHGPEVFSVAAAQNCVRRELESDPQARTKVIVVRSEQAIGIAYRPRRIEGQAARFPRRQHGRRNSRQRVHIVVPWRDHFELVGIGYGIDIGGGQAI